MISGPSELPAAGGPPRQLVVLLHGYGADGADLIGLAPFFARALPHAEFVAPNAPAKSDMGFGYQWFPIGDLTRFTIEAGMKRADAVLDPFLDDALAKRGLGIDRLALIGFSQGTMMALDRAARIAQPAAAIVGFSGMLASPLPAPEPGAKRTPILLVHGTSDNVVPFPAMADAEAKLKQAGFPVETVTRTGLGHGIDGDGALAAARFLASHLPAD